MRKAAIYRNGELAGWLTEERRQDRYIFEYEKVYFNDANRPAISLTLPKSSITHESPYLFPFFFNLLSEGINKKLQSRQLRVDENDSMGLLLKTARYDTIGPVTVREISPEDE